MKKRILAILLIAVTLFSLTVFAENDTPASTDIAGITLTKTATDMEDGTYKIDLTATADSNVSITADPVDIILVLDTSKQMKTNMDTGVVDETLGAERLNGLKTAAKAFIDSIVSPLGERRIAIVKYNANSTILSNNANAANGVTKDTRADAALVPVNPEGQDYLKGIVDELTLTDNAANINYGMNDARKIFQDGQNTGDTSRGNEAIPTSRQRVVVLLSCGMFGNGTVMNSDTYKQNPENLHTAMQAINLGAILKAPRGVNAHPDNYGTAANTVNGMKYGINPVGYFTLTNNSWEVIERGTFGGTAFAGTDHNARLYVNTYSQNLGLTQAADYDGCGATIYCVGLNMPKTKTKWNGTDSNGRKILEYSSRQSNDTVQAGSRGTPAFFINEMFYRISSHRPDSTHPGYWPYNSWEYAHHESNPPGYEQSQYVVRDTATGTITNANGSVTTYPHTCKAVAYDPDKGISGDTNGPARPCDHWSGQYFDQLTRNLDTSFGVTKAYFLTTDTADDLNSLFANIANQNGLRDTKVTVRDYISAYFVPCKADGAPLKEGNIITGEGASGKICKDENGWYIEWTDVTLDAGDISGEGKEAFAATLYVKPTESFLGGDGVPTNGDGSGVYLDKADGTTVFEAFEQPDVNVPVETVTPTFKDGSIYLSQEAQLPHITNMGCFKVGDTEEYQVVNGVDNAYADITYIIEDENGNKMSCTIPAGTDTLDGVVWTGSDNMQENLVLTEDTSYEVTCTVSASKPGSTNKKETTKSQTIKVYTPEITFKDSIMDAGEIADYAANNFVDVVWKHGDDEADTTVMGTAPILEYTYDPEADAFSEETEVEVTAVTAQKDTSGNLKHNVPADMEIVEYVTFVRKACDLGNCDHDKDTTMEGSEKERVNFVVHLNTFDLVIKKNVETVDPGEKFLFRITGGPNNAISIDVTVLGGEEVTIKNLPAGDYTITELTDWSWRYAEVDAQTVAKAEAKGTVTRTFTNKLDQPYWLGGDNFLENIFNAFVAETPAKPEAPTE